MRTFGGGLPGLVGGLAGGLGRRLQPFGFGRQGVCVFLMFVIFGGFRFQRFHKFVRRRFPVFFPLLPAEKSACIVEAFCGSPHLVGRRLLRRLHFGLQLRHLQRAFLTFALSLRQFVLCSRQQSVAFLQIFVFALPVSYLHFQTLAFTVGSSFGIGQIFNAFGFDVNFQFGSLGARSVQFAA